MNIFNKVLSPKANKLLVLLKISDNPVRKMCQKDTFILAVYKYMCT